MTSRMSFSSISVSFKTVFMAVAGLCLIVNVFTASFPDSNEMIPTQKFHGFYRISKVGKNEFPSHFCSRILLQKIGGESLREEFVCAESDLVPADVIELWFVTYFASDTLGQIEIYIAKKLEKFQ